MRHSGATAWATWWVLLAVGRPVPMSRNWRMPASPARSGPRGPGRPGRRGRSRRSPGTPRDLVADLAVDGEVVFAVQPVVPDPGRLRHVGVDLGWYLAGGGGVVCHGMAHLPWCARPLLVTTRPSLSSATPPCQRRRKVRLGAVDTPPAVSAATCLGRRPKTRTLGPGGDRRPPASRAIARQFAGSACRAAVRPRPHRGNSHAKTTGQERRHRVRNRAPHVRGP